MSQTTFIYALLDPYTWQIRYIGKADNPRRRLAAHLRMAKRERCQRACWLRSMIAKGTIPLINIIDEVAVTEWQAVEAAYIEFYRDQGCELVNATDGGEGPPSGTQHPMFGKHVSPERCDKMRQITKALMQSPARRASISAALKGPKHPNFGKHHSKEHRSRIAAALTGRKHSFLRRLRKCGMRHPQFGKPIADDVKKKIQSSLTGKKRSPETGRKISVALCGKYRGSKSWQFGKPKSEAVKTKLRLSVRAYHQMRQQCKWTWSCLAAMWD